MSERRRAFRFRWTYALFGVIIVILAWGITHAVASGWFKLLTAVSSIVTAIVFLRLIPAALALPAVERFKLQLSTANSRVAELAAALELTQIMVCDTKGTIRFWTRGAQSLYGWTPEEAVGTISHELLSTEFPKPLSEINEELRQRGSWSGECRQHCRDGAAIWVASHWTLQTNPDSSLSVIKVSGDITAQKLTEDSLRSSEATAKSLLDTASQGILTIDTTGSILDANLMLESMFQYEHGELIGKSVDILVPDSLRALHFSHRARYATQPRARLMGQGLELVGRRGDGSEFPVEISLNYVTLQGKGLVMAFVSDISARREASRERENLVASLEIALAEKTVLLKEVHHRVKNNLAVIAGLLDMESLRLSDAKAVAALLESQQRVLSMALIHEHLYSTESLNRLNFAEYSQQLAHELCSAFSVDPETVAVTVDAEPHELGVDQAIPCGLILNELLTNALKYAFPDERAGEIRIRFSRLSTGELSLSVEDNGVGVPKDFDWENTRSLGLKIVHVLTRQIDGQLALDRAGQGAKFILTFPAPPLAMAAHG